MQAVKELAAELETVKTELEKTKELVFEIETLKSDISDLYQS